MRILLLAALLPLAACDDGGKGARDAEIVKAARAGMNTVRGIPGGRTASFTAVRLIGGDTVCGMIDGNDGDGPRAFATKGQDVLLDDLRDPATKAAVDKACVGQPVHRIISRNDNFTDLDVAP
ncbi:hypothetical protein ASG29_03360 [Sphingomonas sp. Leaf412]|uniref:hypothetical protein n=1 Tax=Sphingomonas sp. Leaf412 TaxID=1736370 RepID=UPI0006F29FB3|nr:hypothetical protein [Sphingomonas sp. Leaf412]KQT35165.1 hypothetical protein ASG29_03360 [Sphingomonas sp. Leaf412]